MDATGNILAVIPARYESSRFPGKVIAPLAGKPLVQHTYERTALASCVDEVCIATDSAIVADALKPFETKVVMTRGDHLSGTDRIAEVATNSSARIVVNVQGDEPLIDPATIDAVVAALDADEGAVMSTAARLLTDPKLIADPNCVKVVKDRSGRALYFSREPIPHQRAAGGAPAKYWRHIGLYAFRRHFLLEYAKMPPSPLERTELLEQLRALENGYAIQVVETQYESIGVDTPADLERARDALELSLK
jgi:3-deoxy-manno-octulosonate cytidylyltransferase (CMP-KDO synthetase)